MQAAIRTSPFASFKAVRRAGNRRFRLVTAERADDLDPNQRIVLLAVSRSSPAIAPAPRKKTTSCPPRAQGNPLGQGTGIRRLRGERVAQPEPARPLRPPPPESDDQRPHAFAKQTRHSLPCSASAGCRIYPEKSLNGPDYSSLPHLRQDESLTIPQPTSPHCPEGPKTV